MEGVRSPRRLRPAIARGVLRRCVPVLCRAFHAVAELGVANGAGFRQRGRNSDHDDRSLLHFLVKETGQAAAQAADAGQGWLIWRTGGRRLHAGCVLDITPAATSLTALTTGLRRLSIPIVCTNRSAT